MQRPPDRSRWRGNDSKYQNLARRWIIPPASSLRRDHRKRASDANLTALMAAPCGRSNSQENTNADTPASYLRNNLRVGQRALDYERVTRSFFAVSMERDGVIYYSRCNFSGASTTAIHCFDLVYPQEEKAAWDPVVTRISLSLRPRER